MKSEGSSSYLQGLLGLAVDEIFWDGELLGISFKMGWRLTIYNQFAYQVDGGRLSGHLVQHLKGSMLLSVEEECRAVTFKLTGNQELRVNLADDGYRGPEAMQLNGPSGEIVIWN
jgi:hypothetical protein